MTLELLRMRFHSGFSVRYFLFCWSPIVGLCLLSGCEPHGKPTLADMPVPNDQVVDFTKLYRLNCAGCHGRDGKMGPAPPLNDPLLRAIIPQKDVETILLEGRAHTLMPAFAFDNGGNLTRTQIQVLVHEIKGIPYKLVEKTADDPGTRVVVADPQGQAPVWGIPPKAPAGVPAYAGAGAKPENLQTSAKRGATVFSRACAMCHGESGQGMGEGKDVSDKINDPVFLALNSDQVLRRIIITGRSDLGMPSYSEPRPDSPDFKALSAEDVEDLVALLATWRRGAAPSVQPK
jgi:mono/diheme cytochrome c family protein